MLTILAANFGPMLRIAPEARYFSMPSADAGGWFEFVGLELLTVFPINDPLACRFNMLARRDRCRAADDRHQVLTTLDLNLENGKATLGVVVGDPLDQSFEGFGHSFLPSTTVAASFEKAVHVQV